MNWNEILEICKNQDEYKVKGFWIGLRGDGNDYDGFKFADGVVKINDIVKISHVYKIQLHGNMLWINDNNFIIALKDVNDFKII